MMDQDTKKTLADRIKKIAAHFELQEQELAQRLGISKQAMSNYTQAKNEPKPSLLVSLVKIFGINPAWILMGDGDMLGDRTSGIPTEEISKDLTPTQREMLTYKRIQTELGMDKQRIAEGIEAIVMGKRGDERKSDRELGYDADVGFSERDGDGDGDEAGIDGI